MVAIIVLVTVVLFLVLVTWTWKNLGNIYVTKKLTFIVVSIVIMIVLTSIIFSVAKSGVDYKNEEMIKPVKITLVAVFTAINGLVVIQSLGRIIGKVNSGEIKNNDEIKRKLIIVLIVFIIVAIIECFYMKSIQLDILKIFSTIKQ